MAGVITTTQFSSVTPREVDFVTRFGSNWTALTDLMGIMKPIRKTPGTVLKAYKASMVDSALQTTTTEGGVIPFTQFKVEEAAKDDIVVGKYAKAVSVESVAKYGAEIAVQKTDDEFLNELQKKVMVDFYTFLKTGSLVGTQKTWQRALAIAKGAVLNQFANMNKTVTDVVGFANIMDLYDWIGDKDITVQSNFGMQYIKDFMGYSTLFLVGEDVLASGTVIALPVENIDLYYIDPSDSDFAKLGLEYTVEGETNLIGFHAQGNYSTASGEAYALMGLKLWAEYLDGIAVITVDPQSNNDAPAVAQA